MSLSLTGCGGGGSTNNKDSNGEKSKTLHSLDGKGLFSAGGSSFSNDARNPSSGSFADSSEDHTEYSPLTTAISRNFDEESSAVATDFYIKSISNTEAGLEINYMIGSETKSVTMTSADCFEDPAPYTKCQKDGVYIDSWTSQDPMEFDQYDEFEHMEIQYLESDGYRSIYLFGINPERLPTESATYSARFRADAFNKMTSAQNSKRVRYHGRLFLSANFDMSELEGRIHGIHGSQPGQSSSDDRVLWPTSYFTISDGRIVNGQFTAVLTGHDSNQNTPFNQSVRGYMGHILGEFFGPNAEEVGAVINASRNLDGEDHDYVLYGFVGGTEFKPNRSLGSTAINTGNQRKYTENTTKLLNEYGMASVVRTVDSWQINLDSRTIEMRDKQDYGSRFAGWYSRDVAGGREWFWSETDWGFTGNPEFEHFDVKGWSFETRVNPDEKTMEDSRWLVHGNRTPTTAVPTSISATYKGRMMATQVRTDEALDSHTSLATWFNGDVSLSMNFNDSTMNGSFTDLKMSTGRYGQASPVQGGATFNALISSGGFTSNNLVGTGALAGYAEGNVRGVFFGPSAEESAGVYEATNSSSNQILNGWFGTKQTDDQ